MQQLRSSHFQLGQTDQKNQFTSTMKMNFKGDKVNDQATGVGDKLNLRGVHFHLGESKPSYNTIFKTDFQGKQIGEPATLNEEKKNDLRTNHFVLGHQQAQQVSITRATYNEKPLQPGLQNEQEIQKNKMRSHHHNFAESSHKMMQTNYNQQYQPQQLEPKQDLAERARQLRVSNIFLGKEQVPMITAQQEDYNKKEGGAQASFKPGFQSTHFNFGNANADFKTMNQEFFHEQEITKNQFAEENRQNLRATHFTLGKDNQPYQSEQMSHFRPHSENKINYINNTPALQGSHFTIGDPRFMNHKTQTFYNSTMKPPEQQQNSQARDQQMDRGSNFKVGTDNISYKSEMQSHFKNPSGQPAQLSEKLLKDLRSSHFGLNDNVSKNTFMTTKQMEALNQQSGQPNKLDPHASANLRSHHFNLGQTKGDLISQTHDIHRPLIGKPNTLNQQQANNLRKHHFALS
ncbi:unnamed protein product (macronuclear) [Paramecium tetraurelia]|uniref:Uncharacterized protein n=1 Tax=Paramecium tetraurelia TaxID=5888 RepID=A0DN61_PARTE|nr:uncharacterized protein GSPATT00018683001 [Paramecium tetraurelia]CAK84478.1 unnamed protein product [Paramecium tetraurelia]|eukprot:XP_001451875.1 hypothetical protein (macronuclear) [Paramecium tetraurelia strain d4-2]